MLYSIYFCSTPRDQGDNPHVCIRSASLAGGGLLNPVKFYKCLADATRLRCLMLIEHEQELCVCELTGALDEIQPKISRHLAQLRNCGLLVDRRQGQWVFYRINPELEPWAAAVIAETLASNKTMIGDNLAALERMGSRPARREACC